jgi:hypothetical protein
MGGVFFAASGLGGNGRVAFGAGRRWSEEDGDALCRGMEAVYLVFREERK